MYFSECERVVAKQPLLRSAAEGVDELLRGVDVTWAIQASHYASRLNQPVQPVESVLDMLVQEGLLTSEAMSECDCGNLTALPPDPEDEGKCSQCGRELDETERRVTIYRIVASRAALPKAGRKTRPDKTLNTAGFARHENIMSAAIRMDSQRPERGRKSSSKKPDSRDAGRRQARGGHPAATRDGSFLKLLILSVNPPSTERLMLDEEVREIKRRIRAARYGGRIQVEQEWAVRINELHEHLMRHKPTLVHFSGHGTHTGQLQFVRDDGSAQPVDQAAIGGAFHHLRGNIRCVLLNACHSQSQAKEIAKYIECVIGMRATINDESALAFSAAFYQSLCFGESVAKAFELGRNQIALIGLSDEDAPKLFHREGIDPKDVIVLSDPIKEP